MDDFTPNRACPTLRPVQGRPTRSAPANSRSRSNWRQAGSYGADGSPLLANRQARVAAASSTNTCWQVLLNASSTASTWPQPWPPPESHKQLLASDQLKPRSRASAPDRLRVGQKKHLIGTACKPYTGQKWACPFGLRPCRKETAAGSGRNHPPTADREPWPSARSEAHSRKTVVSALAAGSLLASLAPRLACRRDDAPRNGCGSGGADPDCRTAPWAHVLWCLLLVGTPQRKNTKNELLTRTTFQLGERPLQREAGAPLHRFTAESGQGHTDSVPRRPEAVAGHRHRSPRARW